MLTLVWWILVLRDRDTRNALLLAIGIMLLAALLLIGIMISDSLRTPPTSTVCETTAVGVCVQ